MFCPLSMSLFFYTTSDFLCHISAWSGLSFNLFFSSSFFQFDQPWYFLVILLHTFHLGSSERKVLMFRHKRGKLGLTRVCVQLFMNYGLSSLEKLTLGFKRPVNISLIDLQLDSSYFHKCPIWVVIYIFQKFQILFWNFLQVLPFLRFLRKIDVKIWSR